METSQLQLTEELFSTLTEISQDEGMMRKAIKALKRIVEKSHQDDSATMTKDEFFEHIEKASHGSSREFASIDELDKFVRSL